MKVRVSGMVWLPRKELDQVMIEHLRRELTIYPEKGGNYGNDTPAPPIKCYVENAVEFGVPRAWWFKSAKSDYEYAWDVSFGSPIDVTTTLRHTGTFAEQQVCIDEFANRFEAVRDDDSEASDVVTGLSMGGILQAGTGFGKTNSALGLIHQVGVTTLVLVHKEFLQRQWVERIEKFLPDAKVGIVREKRCDFEGKDIVVAMLQSLALASDDPSRYPRELYDWPGLIVIDECHRVGAATWSPIPAMFPAAFRVGLTATPRRKDGADRVFWWHIGEILYRAEKVMPRPSVRVIEVHSEPDEIPGAAKRPGVSPAIVTNALVKMKKRNKRVVREIIDALKAPSGRKVMVLSERLEHLRALEKSVTIVAEREEIHAPTSFYVGEWYTGEKSPLLTPRKWTMDEDGARQARIVIYRTLSRRKWDNPDGSADKGGRICDGRHFVKMTGLELNSIRGLSGGSAYSDSVHEIALDEFDADELFHVAREFRIAQRTKEKKKALTGAQLEEAARARVIFATFQMCSEGLDLPAVDTLVLASPIGDVEQAVGRARRECVPVSHGGTKSKADCEHSCEWRAKGCKGKPEPIVADIVDLGIPMASGRSYFRDKYYRESGFKVVKCP